MAASTSRVEPSSSWSRRRSRGPVAIVWPTLAREETRALVDVTLSQLPPAYREALEAKYLLGRSVRAMAEAWRTTEKTVESRLTRARAAFRVTFEALARFGVEQVEA